MLGAAVVAFDSHSTNLEQTNLVLLVAGTASATASAMGSAAPPSATTDASEQRAPGLPSAGPATKPATAPAQPAAATTGQLDLDGDGVISKAEFRRAPQMQGMSPAVVDDVFASLDTDKSGTIDTSEQRAAGLP